MVFILFSIIFVGCTRPKERETEERGQLEEEPDVVVVNDATGEQKEMKLEEYIAAVVAAEMKSDWPENAYAAQAIIARTFAMEFMERKKTNQISSSFEEAQAFKPEDVTDTIKRAVEKTRGEIALYQGEYIRAWFHSSAAGQTTTAKAGLAFEKDEPPYIVSVKSPDEQAPADIKSWSVTFENRSLVDALVQVAGVQAHQITNIKIVEKDKTGRATKLEFKYDGGQKTISAPKYRNALDPIKLKSTVIKEILKNDKGFTFKGSGFGHGVGMSQWGAHKMAEDGKKPEDIIKYYFRGIEIKKMYN